jgi:hypothetical protein
MYPSVPIAFNHRRQTLKFAQEVVLASTPDLCRFVQNIAEELVFEILQMQNFLTLEEVVERINKAHREAWAAAAAVPHTLRPEPQSHPTDFYVPKLTRRLLNFVFST